MQDLDKLFNKIESLKVGVIGDVMLDTYMWGTVDRISPEAPVPVISLQKKEQRLGGSGNVVWNIQSLSAKSFLISIIGNDEEGRTLKKLLHQQKINDKYCIQSSDRITTNKIRIIGRNQQMMRLDAEITADLNEEDENNLLRIFRNFILEEKPDIVIIQDYNKGVLTESIIKEVIKLCNENNVLTAVDPKRKNFLTYKNVHLFKPNLKEVKEALNILILRPELEVLHNIHNELKNYLNHEISFITLSENGVFYHDSSHGDIIPSHLRNISDVSGAGDTVIAVAAVIYAISKDVRLMAEIANIAGGLVCEQVGTIAIDKEKLKQECKLLLN